MVFWAGRQSQLYDVVSIKTRGTDGSGIDMRSLDADLGRHARGWSVLAPHSRVIADTHRLPHRLPSYAAVAAAAATAAARENRNLRKSVSLML